MQPVGRNVKTNVIGDLTSPGTLSLQNHSRSSGAAQTVLDIKIKIGILTVDFLPRQSSVDNNNN